MNRRDLILSALAVAAVPVGGPLLGSLLASEAEAMKNPCKELPETEFLPRPLPEGWSYVDVYRVQLVPSVEGAG